MKNDGNSKISYLMLKKFPILFNFRRNNKVSKFEISKIFNLIYPKSRTYAVYHGGSSTKDKQEC